MKKRFATILIVLLLVATATLYHYCSMDGLDGFFFSRLFQEDTVYASGYTSKVFRAVSAGMTHDEVLSMLGSPLSEWKACEADAMCWSKSPGDTHYRQRIVFFRNGVVTKVVSQFYVD